MFFKVFMVYLFINKLCIHCLECPLWYPTGFSINQSIKTAFRSHCARPTGRCASEAPCPNVQPRAHACWAPRASLVASPFSLRKQVEPGGTRQAHARLTGLTTLLAK